MDFKDYKGYLYPTTLLAVLNHFFFIKDVWYLQHFLEIPSSL